MTTTNPTDAQMKLAGRCATEAYKMAEDDCTTLHGYAVQSALLAIQATEARMAAAVEADVEKIARIIDPSSWAVMDGYLSDMLRKYKGQNIGYDPDAFKHKPSMKIAEKVLAAIRSQSNG